MVAVCCLVGNSSGVLIGVTTGVPGKMCSWVLGDDILEWKWPWGYYCRGS